MPHWTDDPKIHELMTHLGKVGQSGKPTRSAFMAEQMNRLLVQAETRLAERRKVAKEEEGLSARLEEAQTFVKERKKRQTELAEAIDEAKKDLFSQNPNADTRHLDQDAADAMAEFDDDQEKAEEQIESLTKTVTMKRTTMRRIDDRIEHQRKQVYALLKEWAKSSKAA